MGRESVLSTLRNNITNSKTIFHKHALYARQYRYLLIHVDNSGPRYPVVLFVHQTSSKPKYSSFVFSPAAYSCRNHSSLWNRNRDYLSHSDFNAWVIFWPTLFCPKKFYLSPTEPRSSLVVSIIDGSCKIYTFCKSDKTRQNPFARPPNVEGKSTRDCIRNIPSMIRTSTFVEAYMIIVDSSSLKNFDSPVELFIPSIW